MLPLLAAGGVRAVAMDTPGYGASDPLPEPSIEAFARTAVAVVDALALRPLIVVGHHTGGVIAVEVAALTPVQALVLSSTPVVDEEFRSRPAHGVDDVTVDAHGGHLGALWLGREPLYPVDRTDLLDRFVRDALTAGLGTTHEGHALVRRYHLEDRLDLLRRLPVLLIGAPDDPYGYPSFRRMSDLLPHAETVEIPHGMVPLPDQAPRAYSEAVLDVISLLGVGGIGH